MWKLGLGTQFPETEFINDILLQCVHQYFSKVLFMVHVVITYFSYARTFFTAITILLYCILHILSIEIELARRQYDVFLVCIYSHEKGGEVHNRQAVRGWGGVNILEDARHWIGLLQFNPSTSFWIYYPVQVYTDLKGWVGYNSR
jgi:hypothetical protein